MFRTGKGGVECRGYEGDVDEGIGGDYEDEDFGCAGYF